MSQLDSSTMTASLPDTKTQVMLVGDWQGREFTRAVECVEVDCECRQADDVAMACDILKDCELPPELIFLAQPLPGDVRQGDVDRLQQLVPLARLVVVAGSWCEGELRTGSPPSGVIRLYWYELAKWWQAALRRRQAGRCPLWSLPLDHLQAGRWSSVGNDLINVNRNLQVMIDAADYSVFETLSALLKAYGIASTWRGREDQSVAFASVKAGIWDGGQLSERELSRLQEFCQQIDRPVIALLDFPRVEHFEQAQAAGAAVVFGKPYVGEEVVLALGSAASH